MEEELNVVKGNTLRLWKERERERENELKREDRDKDKNVRQEK